MVGSRVMLRLLAAGRQLRAVVGNSTRAMEMRAVLDTAEPGARMSFSVADRDHDAGRLDAVAGSEFVDDQIRLQSGAKEPPP